MSKVHLSRNSLGSGYSPKIWGEVCGSLLETSPYLGPKCPNLIVIQLWPRMNPNYTSQIPWMSEAFNVGHCVERGRSETSHGISEKKIFGTQDTSQKMRKRNRQFKTNMVKIEF